MAFIFNPNKKRGVFMIPSGATKSPTPAPDPFNNTYSLSMDGVDDFLKAPLDGTSTGGILATTDSDVELTISLWFKLNSSANLKGIFQWANQLNDGTPFILMQQRNSTDRIRFSIDNSYQTTANVNIGQWYNVILTRTALDNTWRGYLDGVEFFDYDDGGSFSASIRGSATDIYLANGYNGYAPCNIDEFAVFNKVLTPTEISEIYNSGVPNDISSISGLSAWYRNGDNGTWKSPQWLIPNNENKTKFSNYSFEYDGVDDFVSISTITYAGAFSISLWINPEDFTLQFICGENGANQNYIWAQTSTLLWFTAGGTATSFTESVGNDLVAGQWQNLIITRDGSNNVNVYRNGVSFGSTTTNAGTFKLDSIGKAGAAASWIYHGNIDDVAVWNSVQDVATIYNSGVPNDISSLSPVGYWRSENSTFSTNWTVTDNGSGSNDGTSANMTIEDRVGDASNSSNNAVSFNMDEVDRETDIPS